jgi:gluconolactonase
MNRLTVVLVIFLSSRVCFSQIENTNDFVKIADGLHFPEGPAWDGTGNLYVSSCHGGYITKISSNEVIKFIDSTFNHDLKQTNGLTVYNDGNIFACDYGLGAILKISPDGKSEIFIDGYNGKNFNRPNDLAFDSEGNLFFTDPKSYGKEKLDGRIFKVDIKSKKVTMLVDSLAFPNGIAFSPDMGKLFVCESARNRILTFKVNDDGSLSDQNVFAELPGGDPDGLAFDVEGNLYVAHFGGGAIYVLSPNGKIKEKIFAPGMKPSNVEFGGDDMITLFITEDETNSVYSIKVKIPGIKLFSSPSSYN